MLRNVVRGMMLVVVIAVATVAKQETCQAADVWLTKDVLDFGPGWVPVSHHQHVEGMYTLNKGETLQSITVTFFWKSYPSWGHPAQYWMQEDTFTARDLRYTPGHFTADSSSWFFDEWVYFVSVRMTYKDAHGKLVTIGH